MGTQTPPPRPLDDPRLAARLRQDSQISNASVRAKAARDRYILERYSWREFPVKYGRWHRAEAGAKSEFVKDTVWEGFLGRWEWRPDYTAVLVLDPATGRPIAEHTLATRPAHESFPPGSTSVWFAGEPLVSGMFTAVGDGGAAVFGRSRALIGVVDAVGSLPDRPFPQTGGPYVERPGKNDGPWLADSPQPPPGPKPGRFGRLTGRS
jgi:hypothetical protein